MGDGKARSAGPRSTGLVVTILRQIPAGRGFQVALCAAPERRSARARMRTRVPTVGDETLVLPPNGFGLAPIVLPSLPNRTQLPASLFDFNTFGAFSALRH